MIIWCIFLEISAYSWRCIRPKVVWSNTFPFIRSSVITFQTNDIFSQWKVIWIKSDWRKDCKIWFLFIWEIISFHLYHWHLKVVQFWINKQINRMKYIKPDLLTHYTWFNIFVDWSIKYLFWMRFSLTYRMANGNSKLFNISTLGVFFTEQEK